MNEQEKLFGDLGRHLPPEGMKRRVMEEIARTPQERRAAPRTPFVRWAGWAALPVAASVALWLALPAEVETEPAPIATVAATDTFTEETLLAALDDIYGVESPSSETSRDNGDETIRAIYGIDGDQKEERNDA